MSLVVKVSESHGTVTGHPDSIRPWCVTELTVQVQIAAGRRGVEATRTTRHDVYVETWATLKGTMKSTYLRPSRVHVHIARRTRSRVASRPVWRNNLTDAYFHVLLYVTPYPGRVDTVTIRRSQHRPPTHVQAVVPHGATYASSGLYWVLFLRPRFYLYDRNSIPMTGEEWRPSLVLHTIAIVSKV